VRPGTRQAAEITVEVSTYRITVEPGITITAPRTSSRDIKRHKASDYDSEVPPGVT
jgi:hypothetical protein